MHDRRRTTLLLALVAAATVVAYTPALGAGFIWDDDFYVTGNRNLEALSGLWSIWFEPLSIPQYYPLVHTTYWLEYRLWGLHPMGYHAVNVALHVTSVVLLFRLLRDLRVSGALLTAGVFALHPVMVESVAWITERKNVLSLVFYLLAASRYLRYIGLIGGARGTRDWWLALLLFLGALTSKSVTFSLPFAVLLLVYWKRGRVRLADVRPLLPFVVAGVAYGFVTSYIEHTHVGAGAAEFAMPLADRCVLAGRTPWFYAFKLVWPWRLVFIYERWEVDAGQLWQWLFPLLTAGLLASLFALRRRLGRGPLTAVLLFGGTLFPALGFISVYPFRYSFVADHFQYHASIGLLALLCAALARAVPARAALPLAVALLGALGARTFIQAQKYHDGATLYTSILAEVPDSWFAEINLGHHFARLGRPDAALPHYVRAKELRPQLDPGPAVPPRAYAHCEIARRMSNVYSLEPALADYRAGRRQEAARRCEQLLPRLQEIVAQFAAAYTIHPGFVGALRDCGRIHESWGVLTPELDASLRHMHQALDLFHRALQAAPRDEEVRRLAIALHDRLAQGFESMKRTDDARRHRDAASRLRAEAGW